MNRFILASACSGAIRATAAAGIAILLFSIVSSHSRAGGVVTSADEASLRAALTGGGTVTFAVDGVIRLSAPLLITNVTTLDGSGHTTTLSGSNTVRVLYVNSGVEFLLENLTIADGRTNSGAGLFNSGGSVTISNCIFTNNVALGLAGVAGHLGTSGQAASGGGIYSSGDLTILDSSFFSNAAIGGAGGGGTDFGGAGGDGSGGVIYNLGTLAVTNSVFQSNGAFGGNGGFAGTQTPGAGGGCYGGAIFMMNGSLNMSKCMIGANSAIAGTAGGSPSGRQVNYRGAARGGAIYNGTGTVAMAIVTMTNNSANGSPSTGGALHHEAGSLTISNAIAMRNTCTADRTTTAITGPGAPGSGGAIYNGGGATFIECLISSNSVAGGAGVLGVGTGSSNGGDAKGGGLCNTGSAGFLRCAFAGNNSAGGASSGGFNGISYGGAVMNGGVAWMVNCTVAANHSGNNGGGIWNSVALTNCTLANNHALAGGNCTPCVCVNTIFFAGAPNNVSGACTDYGHSISSDASAGLSGPGSLNNIDPRLGPIGNYGGPTPTLPLLPGSPALDTADSSSAPSTDQRGRARPSGAGPDIGAFESSPPYTIAGRFFGISGADTILATLDNLSGSATNVPSGGTFRFDNLSPGPHSITASNATRVVTPNPRLITLGPDVFDADFTAYQWNTINLAPPSNGAAYVVYAGTNGQVHRLLASSNLVTWFAIATNVVAPSNYYEIIDPSSVGQPFRVYRSVSP